MINKDQQKEATKMMLSILKIDLNFTAKYNVLLRRLIKLNK